MASASGRRPALLPQVPPRRGKNTYTHTKTHIYVMSKGVKLMAAAWCVAGGMLAQQADSVRVEDESDFTFTESQLDEESDAVQALSSISSAAGNVYLSEVGYLFSPMRFRLRGLDSQYSRNFMNGVMMNNVENGRFSYSGMTGGLNDAMRGKEGTDLFGQNNFGYAGLTGASNINIRASQYAAGSKFVLSATNRNYVMRGSYTYASGVLPSGWSFMGSLAYRWAERGAIEGVFYNSLSYMLGAEKYIGDKHRLSLATWGAPTERAQQGAATEEAYWLANSHYYNPYWGYQNGRRRNSRVVNEYSPNFMATWDYSKDEKTRLTTNLGFTYTMYGTTALGYNNAYNPMPTYYKNMPSSVFNVYNDAYNNGEWLAQNPGILDQYNALRDHWRSKANRQVQWDRIYAMNRAANLEGKDALVYLERRHNDQMVWRLNSVFDKMLGGGHHYTLGLNLNHTKGMHYKTMADLLGSDHFTDLDSYSISDYGMGSQEVQNDLDNPNRSIRVDDRFGYDYDILVNKAQAWGQYAYNHRNFSAVVSADIEGTTMERDGNMRNGRAADYSKGRSGQARFLGGGGRLQLGYRLFGKSKLTLGAGIESQAPLSYNAFVAPRISNNFVNNLQNEQILSAEAAYQFNFGFLSGNVSAYYSRLNNLTRQTAFYNDDASYFTYLTMSGAEQEYKGVEAALVFKLTNNLKVNLIGTIGDAKYLNNPAAQLAYEGSNAATIEKINTWLNPITQEPQAMQVNYKGMREGSTPLTAASVGIDYNTNGWYFSMNLNYYDRVYISPSAYVRLGNVLDNNVGYFTSDQVENNVDGSVTTAFDLAAAAGGNVYAKGMEGVKDGTLLASYAPGQTKCKGGFMLDASIGKSIRLSRGRRLSVNLQLQNITNNRNLSTGGYEQNRNDRSEYQFSKNPYKYYANAFNAFLNLGLRF